MKLDMRGTYWIYKLFKTDGKCLNDNDFPEKFLTKWVKETVGCARVLVALNKPVDLVTVSVVAKAFGNIRPHQMTDYVRWLAMCINGNSEATPLDSKGKSDQAIDRLVNIAGDIVTNGYEG